MTDRTDTITRVREHYNATGLTERIQSALATITPENQEPTIARSLHSTSSILEAFSRPANWPRPLALIHRPACWISAAASAGPARYPAANFGCKVTGVDLSPGFIDAAAYLTARCGLSDRVMFQVGDVLNLPSRTRRSMRCSCNTWR